MRPIHCIILLILVLCVAICFGKIAARNNRNPLLYGILSVIFPINLFILGYWAFGERKEKLMLEIKQVRRFRMQEKKNAGNIAAMDGSA